MRITDSALADVIIVAGGSGSRFGSQKLLIEIEGIPLYEYSLRKFSEHPLIGRVMMVASTDLMDLINSEKIHGVEITCGGETRQQSVLNGIRALSLSAQQDIILVHDAARPLISEKIITDVIMACDEFGAAITALPVTDSIKSDKKGFSAATIDRTNLWKAQTPQAARKELLIKAFEQAEEDNFTGTDESQLLERIGVYPKIVLGSEANMKVTYPEDIFILESLQARLKRHIDISNK